MILLNLGTPLKLFDAASSATGVSTTYALPAKIAQLTWVTSFVSSPASITVTIETSLDNTIWTTADTSTAVAGEERTIQVTEAFVRANITAISGGSGITVNVIAKTGAAKAGSGGAGGGDASAANQTSGNQISQIKSGAKGTSASALITSTASGANHQPVDVAIYDASGNQITSFGGGTQYADVTAAATPTGTVAFVFDGTNVRAARGTTGGITKVDLSGTAANGTAINVTAAQATGTNLHAVVDSGSITATQATASNLNAQVVGDVASGSSDSGNPVKISSVAKTSLPTAASASQRVNALGDVYGRLMTRTGMEAFASNWGHKQHKPAANTQATITLAAGGAGVRNVCTGLTVMLAAGTTAPSAASVTVALIDGSTGGTTYLWGPHTVSLPAVAGAETGIVVGHCWKPGTANTAMTLEFSAAGGANTFETVCFDYTTVAE